MSTVVTDNVWERGRFDAHTGPGKILFGRMYEDASIELGAFRPGGRVLCIASGGCTAIALAPRHEVVAIDINPVQLAYAERRFAGNRGARGAAERFMAFGRSFAPLVGWWPSRLREFLELEDPTAQTAYWRRYLDTGRFRAALDGFLSLTALRAVYAAPFLEFLPQALGAVMRARMARCFARHSNRANPYARALLFGELSDSPPPPEAKDIRLVHADAAGFLELQPAGSFDGFALSNILDGANAAYQRRLFAAVTQAAAPGAMVVLRSFREAPPALATNRAADDRAMLWGIVDVRAAAQLISIKGAGIDETPCY
jgi:S-adenosylmethionine:diacylglycerol 3-amino-3-carboxypropyl transferase